MKVSQSAGHLAIALLSLSTVSQAWPNWLPELDTLRVRDDQTSSSTTIQTTNLNTAGITKTGTATQTGTADGASATQTTTQSNKTTHTTFDATNPVGSVVMTNPASTAGTQLYKIKDYVTFGWNYTNLLATPTAVDVLIACTSPGTATWTLTANMTFETQASYTWDTQQFQDDNPKSQLPVAQYTLYIFDADSSVSATAEAGYLGTYSGLQFGLYTPKAYTSLADWTCATCSAAMSEMERRGLGAVFVMCILTIFSFTWFVTGFAGLTL